MTSSDSADAHSTQADTRYYDGRSAAAHAAALRWSDAALSIDGVAGELAVWPRARLIVSELDPDGRLTLSCKGEPGRVSTVAAALPSRITPPRMQRQHYLGWMAVGIVALVLAFVLVVRLPALGAALVPRSAENQLGEMVRAVVVGKHNVCRGDEGQRALEQLEARLAHAAGIAQPVRLEVIDSKTVNALTLFRSATQKQ